jgi:hypothetical protein
MYKTRRMRPPDDAALSSDYCLEVSEGKFAAKEGSRMLLVVNFGGLSPGERRDVVG